MILVPAVTILLPVDTRMHFTILVCISRYSYAFHDTRMHFTIFVCISRYSYAFHDIPMRI
jgi:hypothetical protein